MEEYKNNALEPNQDNQSFESDDIESMASMHEDNTILNNRKKAEYEEAKEYIGIIMRELEETKGKLASLTVDSKRKKFNAWKGIAIFELICLLSAGTVLSVRYIQENHKSKQAINQGDIITTNAEISSKETTYRYIEDLDSKIKGTNLNYVNQFEITVETLFGYEYLCLTNGNVKVYYRNEFTNDSYDDRFRVLLDNGTKLAEFDWDYDLNGDIKNLYPVMGNFSGDESKQLAFLTYESAEAQMPSKISMVDVESLMEYNPLDIEEALASLFQLSYTEEASNNTRIARMDMNINSASYSYEIKNEHYVDAVYSEQNIVHFNDYFTLDILENKISFKAPVYISNQDFLGELAGNVALKDNMVTIDGLTYGAYVEADQEDPGKSGIITPRDSILDDRLVILGKDNKRYIIPKFEGVALNTTDWDNLIEENGYKVYYENGVKESIMGIDVSKYQGKIDWNQVKEAGVEYVIIRLGFRGMNEGTLELDPMYLEYIEGATKASIPVGIYFFSQAITVEEAKEEAKMVLDNIKDYEITYPIVFDTEYVNFYNARANNITRQERTDISIAFCEEIKAAGYKPMIYSNTKGMIMHIDLTRLEAYDKWFAYYGNKIAFPYNFQMLQYSDTGKVPGIEGNVDLNISFIDYTVE